MAIAPRRQLVEYKNMRNGAPTTPTVGQDGHDGFSSIPKVEDFRTEFKRDVKSSDLERKVVAFLNSPNGGRIFIGVADDGTSVGVVDSDLAQRQIKDRLRDNIRPSCLSREGLLAGRSVPRNKEIMRVFRDLGLVESLGSGVNRILKAYPDTVFDTHDPDFFVVILRFAEAIVKGGPKKGGPKRGGPKKGGPKNEKGGLKRGGPKAEKGGLKRGGPKKEDYLNQGVHVRIRIAELLANGEATTTAQLIERLGKARSTVFKHLALLRRMNVIRYVGSSKTGHWEVLGSFPKQ